MKLRDIKMEKRKKFVSNMSLSAPDSIWPVCVCVWHGKKGFKTKTSWLTSSTGLSLRDFYSEKKNKTNTTQMMMRNFSLLPFLFNHPEVSSFFLILIRSLEQKSECRAQVMWHLLIVFSHPSYHTYIYIYLIDNNAIQVLSFPSISADVERGEK